MPQFDCAVKTKHGEADHKTVVTAQNAGIAQTLAISEAKSLGLTPTGRVKAVKIQE